MLLLLCGFQIKLLEEEIAELEALEEVHEQLVESNHELELDLREELDMAQAAKREVGFEKIQPKSLKISTACMHNSSFPLLDTT